MILKQVLARGKYRALKNVKKCKKVKTGVPVLLPPPPKSAPDNLYVA